SLALAGWRLAKHHERGGGEPLRAQRRAELALERVRRHVLLVEHLHRQHRRVEVRQSRRDSVDVRAQRAVGQARERVRIVVDASQDLGGPIGGGGGVGGGGGSGGGGGGGESFFFPSRQCIFLFLRSVSG